MIAKEALEIGAQMAALDMAANCGVCRNAPYLVDEYKVKVVTTTNGNPKLIIIRPETCMGSCELPNPNPNPE